MDAVLENKNFSYNNNQYILKERTAIGFKLGRDYARTYMGDWERILLEKCNFMFYIDDIFRIWLGTEANFLYNFMNLQKIFIQILSLTYAFQNPA